MQNPETTRDSGFNVFLIIVFLLITAIPLTNAQVSKADLVPLLSSSDQKKLEKIDATFNKGKAMEDEALQVKNSSLTEKDIVKNEKKYTLKRLEASQYFQKANFDFIALLKDNVETFWKNNKGIEINPDIKAKEDKAIELTRKSKSTRYVAEDLVHPDEKLSKILEAEAIEKEAIDTYIKVLYTYRNYPIAYDEINAPKKETVEVQQPASDSIKTEVKHTPPSLHLSSQLKTDSITTHVPSGSISNQKNDQEVKLSKAQPVEEIVKKDSGSIYGLVDVNEDQIDKFNKFLEDSFPDNYEAYVINFRNLDYTDINSLRDAWHKYIFNKPIDLENEEAKVIAVANDTSKTIATNIPNNNRTSSEKIKPTKKTKKESSSKGKSDSINTASLSTNKTETQKEEQPDNAPLNEAVNENSKKKDIATGGATKKEKASKKEQEKTIVSEEKKQDVVNNVQLESAKGFVYRIQISACRIPLDSKAQQSIYDGEHKIIELNEDNWYKYAIGEFPTYADAKRLKDNLNVPGAFVIAYLNGKRIKILQSKVPDISYDENVTFKVQIAASKTPLNENYVRNIYAGEKKVDENLEDGWYKYTINMGSVLRDAKNFIEKEDIPGAFITSYMGNTKVELREAIKMNNSTKK
ncbi:MAG TPA: hypothetical protein VHO90_00710 [Bacteroidales bacterium]|nr:hypothetical protein [Bacteroidales bacterium]